MTIAGIPEKNVLKIATQNSANALGKGSMLGSIEPGKLADLFIVQGNPLEDITNTRNVQKVVRSGQQYDPPGLLDQAKGRMGPESPEETENWFLYEEIDGISN